MKNKTRYDQINIVLSRKIPSTAFEVLSIVEELFMTEIEWTAKNKDTRYSWVTGAGLCRAVMFVKNTIYRNHYGLELDEEKKKFMHAVSELKYVIDEEVGYYNVENNYLGKEDDEGMSPYFKGDRGAENGSSYESKLLSLNNRIELIEIIKELMKPEP